MSDPSKAGQAEGRVTSDERPTPRTDALSFDAFYWNAEAGCYVPGGKVIAAALGKTLELQLVQARMALKHAMEAECMECAAARAERDEARADLLHARARSTYLESVKDAQRLELQELRAENERLRSGIAEIGKMQACNGEVWGALCAIVNIREVLAGKEGA